MERFMESIRNALTQRNWYAALFLGLALPDICARLESDDEKTNTRKYIAWFNKYMADRYKTVSAGVEHILLSGNDCYALRCAMLHEGIAEITSQRVKDTLGRFHFTVVGSHCNRIDAVLQLDVPTFCEDICTAAERWFSDFQTLHADKLGRLEQLVQVHVGTSGLNFSSGPGRG